MSYATVEQLAAALRLPVTAGNTARLQECLDAAAAEIDHWLGDTDTDPLPEPAPALAVQVNVARAVAHYKASDAVLGVLGAADTGTLSLAGDDFAGYASDLMPLVRSFGVA